MYKRSQIENKITQSYSVARLKTHLFGPIYFICFIVLSEDFTYENNIVIIAEII